MLFISNVIGILTRYLLNVPTADDDTYNTLAKVGKENSSCQLHGSIKHNGSLSLSVYLSNSLCLSI